uniref:Uncharacterized protein n=1 Tax=Rhizophora mucronata TaxID=61149 RepID=A0A2P2IYF6_RHIMU
MLIDQFNQKCMSGLFT